MTWPYALSWFTVMLPLAGAIFSFIAETPRRAAQVCITFTLLAVVAAVAVLGFRVAHYQTSGTPYESLITFFTLRPDETRIFPADLHPEVGVHVDNMSITFAALAVVLSSVVQMLATVLLRGDAAYRRFFWLAALHTFGLAALALSPGLFQTWLGLGVMSAATLMLGMHWWQREAAPQAARRSFLTLLASDLALLFVLVFDVAKLGSFIGGETLPQGGDLTVNDPYSYALLNPAWRLAGEGGIPNVGARTLIIFAVLAIVIAAVRSAAAPFSGWLASLVEAPLPALALLGGGGLLAGPLLLGQLYPLLIAAPHMLGSLAILGGGSAVILGILCLLTVDIYRLAALSAATQMSLALVGLGVGGFSPGLFAAFAAAPAALLLFVVAGNLVRTYRTRSIIEMGGAFRRMPRTATALVIWALATAGGNLAGYHVLAATFRDTVPGGGHLGSVARGVTVVLVLVAMLLSAVYPARLIASVGRGEPVKRRGFLTDRVVEVDRRLRGMALLASAGTVLAALCAIPGIDSFTAGKTHVPGLTFSHWVYLGGSRQILALDGRALAVAAGVLVAGLLGGWTALGSPTRADLRARVGRLARVPITVVTAPFERVGAAAGTILRGGESAVLKPILDAPGDGIDLLSRRVDGFRTRRLGLGVGFVVVVVLVLVAAGAAAAGGLLPVHTR
ncbi:MAG: proton-conducting transporter membrane subunit [Candidatus Dormibacteria bacterium]